MPAFYLTALAYAAVEAQPDIVRYLVATGAACPPVDMCSGMLHGDVVHPAVAAAACKKPERGVEVMLAIFQVGREELPGLTAERRKEFPLLFNNAGSGAVVYAAHLATLAGAIPMMELLASGHGADLFVEEREGEYTCLHAATEAGDLATVQWIDSRVHYNPECTDYQVTPLLLAVEAGHADIVRYLIEAGHSVGTNGTSGECPATSAAESGNAEIINLVIGAFDVYMFFEGHEKDDLADIALSAAFAGATPAVRKLMRLDASEPDSILKQACRGGHVDTVEAALSMGADSRSLQWMQVPMQWPEADDEIKASPLDKAHLAGHDALVRFLAEEADFAAAHPSDWAADVAQHVECGQGYAEAAQYLVEEMEGGSDRATMTKALALALTRGHAEMNGTFCPQRRIRATRPEQKAPTSARAMYKSGACWAPACLPGVGNVADTVAASCRPGHANIGAERSCDRASGDACEEEEAEVECEDALELSCGALHRVRQSRDDARAGQQLCNGRAGRSGELRDRRRSGARAVDQLHDQFRQGGCGAS